MEINDSLVAYIAKELEVALVSLQGISAEGLDMKVYAKALNARMCVAGAHGALELHLRELEARR
jgi:hypothetical protein